MPIIGVNLATSDLLRVCLSALDLIAQTFTIQTKCLLEEISRVEEAVNICVIIEASIKKYNG